MGRDKKSKKGLITLCRILCIIVSPIIYELLIHLFANLSLGTLWEELLNAQLQPSQVFEKFSEFGWAWISLILCRLTIYLLPSLMFFLLSFIKRDKRKSKIKTYLKCLNLQFLGYLIYQCLTIVLGLDYLIGLQPFANVSIYMSLFGYIATISRNKEIEFGKIEDDKM